MPEQDGTRITDAALAPFLSTFRAQFGATLAAVLLYGSYVRGKRDTVLDFYVLLDSYVALPGWAAAANRLLPPNVYHLTCGDAACKFATVTVTQFAHAIETDVHTYFWSRFAQPFTVAYARDTALVERLGTLGTRAALRMLATTAPLLPERFTSGDAWRQAFTLTYGCELRAEDSAAAARLHAAYAGALDLSTTTLAAELGWRADDAGGWRQGAVPSSARAAARRAWWLRRVLGKLFSVARLLKAALTFNDPLGYVVWKVARHSGVREEPSPRARRHPLIFGWGVLWRLYRRGGFR